jgi:hypothetical protein
MATPHVAGAAALYLEGAPTASPATVNSAIVSNATPNRLYGIGAGSPNLLLYTLGGTTTNPGSLSASIFGSNYLTGATTGYWTATASGGNGSYSYQWQYRAEGASSWSNVGGNSTEYYRSVGTYAPSFYLRVIVTSGGASVTSAEYFVYHEPGEPMCGDYLC